MFYFLYLYSAYCIQLLVRNPHGFGQLRLPPPLLDYNRHARHLTDDYSAGTVCFFHVESYNFYEFTNIMICFLRFRLLRFLLCRSQDAGILKQNYSSCCHRFHEPYKVFLASSASLCPKAYIMVAYVGYHTRRRR
jgi:hypothetical protein